MGYVLLLAYNGTTDCSAWPLAEIKPRPKHLMFWTWGPKHWYNLRTQAPDREWKPSPDQEERELPKV